MKTRGEHRMEGTLETIYGVLTENSASDAALEIPGLTCWSWAPWYTNRLVGKSNGPPLLWIKILAGSVDPLRWPPPGIDSTRGGGRGYLPNDEIVLH